MASPRSRCWRILSQSRTRVEGSEPRGFDAQIEQLIIEVRGQKVMLDQDLAEIYGVETKASNQTVLRNLDRFPDDLTFRLTKTEWEILKSRTVSGSWLLA